MTKILLDTPRRQEFQIGNDKSGLFISADYTCQHWEVNVQVNCGIADMDESLLWHVVRVYEAIGERIELLQSKINELRAYMPITNGQGVYVYYYSNGIWAWDYTLESINDDGSVSLAGIEQRINPLLVRV